MMVSILSLVQDLYLPPPFPIQLPAFTETTTFGAQMKEKHFFIDVRAHCHMYTDTVVC